MSASNAHLPGYASSTRSWASNRSFRGNGETKEFHYDVKNRKGKSFIVLTLIAERLFSKHIPTFLQDKNVEGRVHVNFENPESVRSVTVSVQGQYLTGANPDQCFTFLNQTYTLWSQSNGRPQNVILSSPDSPSSTSTPNGSLSLASTSKFNGKLYGEYVWPFSIQLPKDVTLPYGKANELRTFDLPQTFNERHSKGSINYEVYLRIGRGRFQPDDRTSAKFGYLPISRPPPFPPLRRLCYQENSPLLGPIADPEGWFCEKSIPVVGNVFNHRTTQIRSTLFMAKPLSYTRGSLIPCSLHLECGDTQALDLIAAPNSRAILVFLKRRIRYHSNPLKAIGTYARDTVDYVQAGVWWPSAMETTNISYAGPSTSKMMMTSGSGRSRWLNGEIHLQADLKPSSAMFDFRIEYSVVMFPFSTAGFEPSTQGEPIVEYPVDIVTSYAHGPRPRKLAPPGYDSGVRPPQQYMALEQAPAFV